MKDQKNSQNPIADLSELKSYFTTHNAVRDYIAHSSKVHSVGWSCDGRRLASGSFDKSVAIFNLEKNRLVQDFVFRGHTGSVDQLCWHASHSDLLSTASGDKSVRIWDARSHKCVATIPTKGENINIAWSPNGNTIAVGNKEDLVSFIDTKTYKVVTEEQFNFEVNEISWNKTSDLFFLTNGLGCVHIMAYPTLEVQTVLKAHPGTCICIEQDPTGRFFATGSADALVSLWDVNELAPLRVFSRLEWPVRTLSFSFDGRLLASGSEDHVIDIGDTETGRTVVSPHPEASSSCDDADTDSSEIDEPECKRRKRECLRTLTHLEHQFTVLQKQLYKEKLNQVNKQLSEVRNGRSLEYIKPLKRLQEKMRDRIRVAGILKTVRLESIKNKFEAEQQSAQNDFINEKSLEFDSMKEKMEKKIIKLEEKCLKVDFYSGNLDRGNRKRKRPAVSPPYIVYMLPDAEIMKDWRIFKNILKRQESEKVADIPVSAATFTVAWHPSRYLLAFACEDKEPPERKRDAGNLKLWGLPHSSS